MRFQNSENKEKVLKPSRKNSHIFRVTIQNGIRFLRATSCKILDPQNSDRKKIFPQNLEFYSQLTYHPSLKIIKTFSDIVFLCSVIS